MIYINKDSATIYVELSEALNAAINEVGHSWEDYLSGKWVLLSDEQVAFHQAHAAASVEEVFNRQLLPSIPASGPEPTAEEKLEQARRKKIVAVCCQDRSTEAFTVNGIALWLDKNVRTSLVANTLPAEKAAGKTETTLWYAGQPPIAIRVPIAWLEEKLAELELYAKATYDTTQSHLAAIHSFSTPEEIESYDPTTGYPEMLAFILP